VRLPGQSWARFPAGANERNIAPPIVFLTAHGDIPTSSLLGPDFHRLDRTSFRLAHSLDHLVGTRKQRRRHGHAERFGSLEANDQLELGRLLYWQFAKVGAFKYAINVSCCSASTDPLNRRCCANDK